MFSFSPRLVTLLGLLLALFVSVHIQSNHAFVSRSGHRFATQWSRSISEGSLPAGQRVQQTVLQMGLLDGLKKIVGAQDPVEAMLQDNEKTLKTYHANVEAINKSVFVSPTTTRHCQTVCALPRGCGAAAV